MCYGTMAEAGDPQGRPLISTPRTLHSFQLNAREQSLRFEDVPNPPGDPIYGQRVRVNLTAASEKSTVLHPKGLLRSERDGHLTHSGIHNLCFGNLSPAAFLSFAGVKKLLPFGFVATQPSFSIMVSSFESPGQIFDFNHLTNQSGCSISFTAHEQVSAHSDQLCCDPQ